MDRRQLRPLGGPPPSQFSGDRRQPASPPSLRFRTAAWGQPGPRSSLQQELQTEDWVCEPPERRSPARRWSVTIDERRRLAMLGARDRLDAPGAPSHIRDITQIVAELVSEDVDKDVLLPHPPRSPETSNAFQDFLARSAPFWQNSTFQARTSRSPPS